MVRATSLIATFQVGEGGDRGPERGARPKVHMPSGHSLPLLLKISTEWSKREMDINTQETSENTHNTNHTKINKTGRGRRGGRDCTPRKHKITPPTRHSPRQAETTRETMYITPRRVWTSRQGLSESAYRRRFHAGSGSRHEARRDDQTSGRGRERICQPTWLRQGDRD